MTMEKGGGFQVKENFDSESRAQPASCSVDAEAE